MVYALLKVEEFSSQSVVRLNRPDKRNALNRQMRDELLHCLHEICGQNNTVIITGEGSAFCAGLDLKELPSSQDVEQFMNILKLIYENQTIFIAAVNGSARGGGAMLVNACDLAFSIDTATFGLPKVILESSINTFSIKEQQELGEKSKSWQGLKGKVLSAQQAKDEGLLNEVVFNEDIVSFTLSQIRKMDINSMQIRKQKSTLDGFRNTLLNKQSIILRSHL